MLESKTRWMVQANNEQAAEHLIQELQISPLIAKLLTIRGITSVEDAEAFLTVSQEHFHDPYLLDGMSIAVPRIRKALESREKIRIYGDYDADGVSSTSLMIGLLRELGADFDYYIPHRQLEGYGLNLPAVEQANQDGVSLMITVDTGISAVEQIAYANELGIDVIVTDHHEPPEILPQALAIINPKKPGCTYPFKSLAGVGVALKLAQALMNRTPIELMQFAAIGTVADLMPLVGENRLIVKLGIEAMQLTELPGLRALIECAGIEKGGIDATGIGFGLAPRINASGRLDHARHAVELLTTADDQMAEALAFQLDQLNKERQRIVDDILKQALKRLNENPGTASKRVTVVAEEGWNVGVVGIVASKLMDKMYRPTVVLSIDPDTGMAKGSARSITGFDMYKALTECADLLDHYGGHQAAAGMTLAREHIPAFEAKLNELAEQWLNEEDYIPVTEADLTCEVQDITLNTIEQLAALAPFGMGNASPRFIIKQAKLQDIRALGKDEKHLKLQIIHENGSGKPVECIGFGFGSLVRHISPQARIEVLGELQVNEWNGHRKPQVLIQDICINHIQLFDYRGRPADQLADDVLDYRNHPETSVICFTEEDVRTASEVFKLSRCSLYLISDTDGSVQAVQAVGSIDLEHTKDLVIWGMPIHKEQLIAALKPAVNTQRIYTLLQQREASSYSIIPPRDAFKKCYGALQQQAAWNMEDPRTVVHLSKRSGLSPEMIRFIVEVFEDLSFIRKENQNYIVEDAPQKKELTSSARFQQQVTAQELENLFVLSTHTELETWLLEHIGNMDNEASRLTPQTNVMEEIV